jgi:hypothetical protein
VPHDLLPLRAGILAALSLGPALFLAACEGGGPSDSARNPKDTGSPPAPGTCADANDNDGDGWTDADDPDCASGTEEVGLTSGACNDGVDNDGDGAADAADPDCASAADTPEAPSCEDGLDDDGDGWIDDADPDCETGDEAGLGDGPCNDGTDDDGDGMTDADDDGCTSASDPSEAPSCEDGLDDDGDGWTDADDPDCADGTAETGYGAAACADGIDNDGDAATDAADPDCTDAADTSELPSCEDGLDDDGDGWIDAADPDCQAGLPESGFGDAACNDGEDHDGDGTSDADDDDCTSAADASEYPSCEDGLDDDGDGWTDAADPDCASGGDESGYGTAACNDGVDSDGDGDIDAADPGCTSADDPSEAPDCMDTLDGDGDGWIDGDDPDCTSGSAESGYGSDVCNDGSDNDGDGSADAADAGCASATDPSEAPDCSDGLDGDGDGWTDGDDPDCTSGSAEVGYGADVCNDGVDNEGDGKTDAGDPGCTSATDPSEAPDCMDGLDGDGDGWTDSDDPDCTSGSAEVGYGSTECNDGVDNDGNGDVDGADPECTDASITTEAADCSDGLDGDGDGWTDADDPDCTSGSAEVGYGTAACNDGIDNDGDGDIDAADPGCTDASDTAEGMTASVDTGDTGCTDSTLTCSYDDVAPPATYWGCQGITTGDSLLYCTSMPSGGCEAATDLDASEIYDLVQAECAYGWLMNTSSASVACGPTGECSSECCYVVTGVSYTWTGRPFPVAGELRVARPRATGDWGAAVEVRTAGLERRDRARVAARWARMAMEEHASIASFARFSLQLMAMGAPPELLLATQRATADEVAHARLCFGVASAVAGEAVGVGPMDVGGALDGALDPAAILAAAIREGCVGETLAAAEAAEAREGTHDGAIRRVLEKIAEDEAGHAALAWRFVRWALDAHPELRDVAERAFEAALSPPPLPRAEADAALLARFGVLDARARAASARRVLAEVVGPCAAALLGAEVALAAK